MNETRSAALPEAVRAEYPFTGNLLTLSDGSQLHYLDEGKGPVVLMLHGNPTWSFYYRNLVKALSGLGFRCIVPDHIGCGLSDKPQNYTYTLEQRIKDVGCLLAHLGIDRYSLVVHDWGGAIGCGLAGRSPEQLERLVLLNTAAFTSKRIPWRIAAVKMPWLGQLAIRGLNAFAGPAAGMSVVRPLAPAVREGLLWPYRTWADRVAVWNFVKDIPLGPRHPSFSCLAAVQEHLGELADKPVRIIWGEKDFCFNRHFLARWQEIFPNAESHLMRDCGHYVLEDGGDQVIRLIAQFLGPITSESG